MESKEVITIINEIEDKFPVNKWKIGAFDVWPYIRFRLGSRLFERKLSGTKFEKLLYRYGFGIFRLLSRTIINLFKVKEEKNCEFLFLENGIHLAKHEGKFFYVRTDPIREKLEKIGKRCQMNVCGYEFDAPSFFPNIHIQYLLDICLLSVKKNLLRDLEGYDDFLQYIQSRGVYDKGFEIEEMVKSVNRMEKYRDFFKKKLKKMKPKAVFILCYYSTYGFGMIKACKELKIPIVDVQHGIQGKSHYAYGSFNNISKESLNLLPDIFYVWGQEEKDVIEAWGKKKVEVFKGGNDYLNLWKSSTNNFVKKTIQDIYERYSLKEFSKVILFTVYPGADHDDLIIKAIQNSPADWIWFVRHHPKSNTKSERIRKRIGKVKCGLKINGISSIPLFALLKVADAHITERSSTIIEACYFGVPSVVTTKECKELFKTQFDQKMVSLKENVEDIVVEIAQSKKKTPILYDKEENIAELIEMIEQKYAHHN